MDTNSKEPDEYLLRWREHNPQLISQFNEMWRQDNFTDVTIATDKKMFQAHKLVLSACSPYFRQLFSNNPGQHPILYLKEIPDVHVSLLLDYMYCGTISVEHDQLSELMKTAASLQIRGFSYGLNEHSRISEASVDKREVSNALTIDEGDNEKFQPIKPCQNGGEGKMKKCKSKQRKSEGRKSFIPKKIHQSGSESEPSTEDQECKALENQVNDVPSSVDNARYSILGSYLNSCRSQQGDNDNQELTRRSSTGDSHEDTEQDNGDLVIEEEEDLNEEDETASLTVPDPSLIGGMDIAERLRSHFLANIPAPGYPWLNRVNNGIRPGTNNNCLPSQAIPSLPPPFIDKLDKVKQEKHPLGGIKTGEIGPNGKPSVKCEECGKLLADPSSLYRHRKIHTGDKPHKCPHCPRRFIQRYNMKQHIKTHRIERLSNPNQEKYRSEDIAESLSP